MDRPDLPEGNHADRLVSPRQGLFVSERSPQAAAHKLSQMDNREDGSCESFYGVPQAFREVGRVERTLFLLPFIADTEILQTIRTEDHQGRGSPAIVAAAKTPIV
jgi:hypothetical protein